MRSGGSVKPGPYRLASAAAVAVPHETFDQKLARARGYPYSRPSSSFLFVNGKAHTFEDSSWRGVENLHDLEVAGADNVVQRAGTLLDSLGLRQRTPTEPKEWFQVLAIGSNAAPEQLSRKFSVDLFPEGFVIPTIRGVLSDFDVVYAPLISSYGSCTATLEYSPNTACEVFVSFMTQPQMHRMNETEGAYNLCKMSNIVLDIGVSLADWRESGKGAQQLNKILQFNHQFGTLHMPDLDGQDSPVALKEIPAISRKFRELSQVEMQQLLMENFPRNESRNASDLRGQPKSTATEDCLNSWILANLDDTSQRAKIVELLAIKAKAFSYKDTEVLLRLGNQFSANVE